MVATVRGFILVEGDPATNPLRDRGFLYPAEADRPACLAMLDEVTLAFGFETVDDYLDALEEEGAAILQRLVTQD